MPSKKYSLSLFIFRRDLRLHDNTGLIEACKHSKEVIPAFFFDERLLDNKSDRYRPNVIQFMIESLRELNEALFARGSRLYFFYGKIFFDEFKKLLLNEKIEAVFLNEDYTPFSKRRDTKLKEITLNCGVDFKSFFDLVLTRPGEVITGDEKPYKIFTPFFKNTKTKVIRKPERNNFKNFYKSKIANSKNEAVLEELLPGINEDLCQRGGRTNALKTLRRINEFKSYEEKRNFPSVEGTTKLSAHVRLGTVSIREFYWSVRNKLGSNNPLITELFWRDFYTHLTHFFPCVFGHSFNKKYELLKWENDKEKFNAWCKGLTGFPIVDAGMRQLNKTGWMHNRVRMIVASFLTKDLHIDWKWGEKYFSSKLVDYDPSSNNGGWQWAASTGADAQPYFRIFNPWRQQERFDPDALYIKEWIPELSDLTPKEIHNLNQNDLFSRSIIDYPDPIVDHKIESEKAKDMYTLPKSSFETIMG